MSYSNFKVEKKNKEKNMQIGCNSDDRQHYSENFSASTNFNQNYSSPNGVKNDDLPNQAVPHHMSSAIPRKNRSIKKHEFTLQTKQIPNTHGKQSIHAQKRFMALDEKLTKSVPLSWERGERQNKMFEISQTPLVIGIKFIHLSTEILNSIKKVSSPRLRTSGRNLKRKLYVEAKESDSDFLEDSDDDDKIFFDRPKKRLQKASSIEEPLLGNIPKPSGKHEKIQEHQVIYGEDIAAPPSGTLASLWYSQEIYSNLWVIDKIIGWKKRAKVSISYKNDSIVKLSDSASRVISDKLINYYIPRSSKRMELSRICPTCCPIVLKAFVEQQGRKIKMAKESNSEISAELKQNTINEPVSLEYTGDLEEVLLIKWRGKSHLHCSWERPSDLQHFDTTNNTAKGKIKRFYQSQHMKIGKNWKEVLENHTGMGSKSDLTANNNEKNQWKNHNILHLDEFDNEEYFSPDCIEVERILACDESEIDMTVMSIQREINLLSEKDRDGQQSQNAFKASNAESEFLFLDVEKPWDPEDNVRYVVKWKSLQLTEITWEYWMHIKHKCVDQVEDFWYRQTPLGLHNPNCINTHPSVRDYKKLTESPTFGVSSRIRTVGKSCQPETSMTDVTESQCGLKLRTYQLEGVNWLIWNWWNNRSCILADEMGLGKTIQSICFLDQLYKLPKTNVPGPYLIVAPLSLVNQWQAECETWAPDFNVILYHGSSSARNYLFQQEFFFSEPFVTQTVAKKLKRQNATKFNIIITTYEVIMKDLIIFSKIRWKALIVDEAHRLKNNESRLFTDMGSIPREFCLLLTGTPLQNTTEELWSLLNFAEPNTFSSKEDFVSKFGQLLDSKQVSELHAVLRPYLLRRVKEDVEKSLPPKEETILEVSLTPIQKTYYKAIYEKNTSFLMKGSKSNNAPSLMNVMMELRKCCNHPFLIKGAEERIMNEAITPITQNELNIDPLLRWQKVLSQKLVQSSGKMVVLMKLLPKLQSGGHKVLIFSQMVKMLELLEELLRFNKFNYERLDGSTSASSRQAAVNRFNKKSYNKFVMLLSTRAGGLGLNLTSADTVIIFDSDWNPQNDLQAMARAHRIGQTRAVKVYRLLTAKTYEMHMFHSASMKLGLDRAVLAHQRQNELNSSKGRNSESEKLSQAKEIDQLLKKGAYDVFRDDDDTDAKQFMESDIDQLLERSSTVTYGNSAQSFSKSLGSFSKASFVTSDADGKDIDLDDPDFWSKAIGLEFSDANDENIVINEKRNRKQVQVFDPYASFAEEEQKKKDKLALKVMFEKEEKKRLKEEQKLKREEEKERKKREREDLKKAAKEKLKVEMESEKVVTKNCNSNNCTVNQNGTSPIARKSEENKKLRKEIMNAKSCRDEEKRQKRALLREDPIRERVKQAWDSGHRDKLLCLLLEFGFGRMCKIRNEASLQSIPLHDVEIFIRALMFQLGVQAHVSVTKCCINKKDGSIFSNLGGCFDSDDGKWVLNAIISAGNVSQFSNLQKRDLRIPQTLIQTEFLKRLQSGVAISCLFRLSFLSRFNKIFDEAIAEIFAGFGQEELGKRGCFFGEVSNLDIDLKARHITPEELRHSIGKRIDEIAEVCALSKPAPWWNRRCDLNLLIGTFYHGLGNYKAMFNDEMLPFKSIMENANAVSCSIDTTGTLSCMSQSIKSFFEPAVGYRLHRDEKKSEICKEEIIDNNDVGNVGIKNEETDLSQKEKAKPNGCNVVNPLEEVNLNSLSDKLFNDLTTITQKKYMAHIKASIPSIELLNSRIEHLVLLIEHPQSSKFSEIDRRNYLIDQKGHINESISVTLFHFLRTLGHYKLESRFSLNSYLKDQTQDPTSPQTCIDIPIEKRGLGLPKMITWLGFVGLLYADKAIVKELVNSEAVICGGDYSSCPQNQLIFESKIPTKISCDNELRQCLCASLLCCGMPSILDGDNKFQLTHLINIASQLLKSGKNHDHSLTIDEVQLYFTNTLLPHCLRLSLHFEDNTINSSILNGKNVRHLLPDPTIQICEHSKASCELATIILRRVKLCHAIQHIMKEDAIIKNILFPILQNKKLLPKSNENDIPIWWVPEIHDFALLQYASRNGLLTIVMDYKDQSNQLSETIFEKNRLEIHVREFFFDEDKPIIPKFLQVSSEEIGSFISGQLRQFPSAFAIERRLDFIVGSVCHNMRSNNAVTKWTYFNLPLFDQ